MVSTMTTDTISEPRPAAPAAMTCRRDGAATRLTCSRCGDPICTSCLARTAVGMRCPACATDRPGPSRRRRRPVAALVIVALGAAGAVALRQAGGRASAPEAVAEGPAALPAAGQLVTVGQFAVTVAGFDCTDVEAGTPPVPLRRCAATLAVRNDALDTRAFPLSLQRVAVGIRRFRPVPPPEAPSVNPGTTAELRVEFLLPAGADPGRMELRSSAEQLPVRVTLPA